MKGLLAVPSFVFSVSQRCQLCYTEVPCNMKILCTLSALLALYTACTKTLKCAVLVEMKQETFNLFCEVLESCSKL